MFELSQFENQIIIRRNAPFLRGGVGAVIMSIVGVRLLFGILPFEEGYTSADVFGLVFVCVWILSVLMMGLFSLATYSKQITINSDGVLCKSWFTKEFVKWSDIKDWGLSYYGRTQRAGNEYYLYFSKEIHPVKNECKKRLRGKMMKIFVIGSDYDEAINKIIPFCSEKTKIEPFIGKDKYHFL